MCWRLERHPLQLQRPGRVPVPAPSEAVRWQPPMQGEPRLRWRPAERRQRLHSLAAEFEEQSVPRLHLFRPVRKRRVRTGFEPVVGANEFTEPADPFVRRLAGIGENPVDAALFIEAGRYDELQRHEAPNRAFPSQAIRAGALNSEGDPLTQHFVRDSEDRTGMMLAQVLYQPVHESVVPLLAEDFQLFRPDGEHKCADGTGFRGAPSNPIACQTDVYRN